jgi:ABC-type antimicrobial peptide transport system permease subunit
VLSFLVEQRRKEIGVRMALGATAGSVMKIVLLRLVRLVGAGLVAGSLLAALLTMVLLATPLASFASGVVQVFDPVAYTGSALCIALASLVAALVPARRAASIDPMATLRDD